MKQIERLNKLLEGEDSSSNKSIGSRYAELERRFKTGDKAAEREAQQMVNKTAKKKGYIRKGIHISTQKSLTRYDLGKNEVQIRGNGIYMWEEPDAAYKYMFDERKHIHEFFVSADPLLDYDIDYNRSMFVDLTSERIASFLEIEGLVFPSRGDKIHKKLSNLGSYREANKILIRDGIRGIRHSTNDENGTPEPNGDFHVLIVFFPSQIKSAEPFTYDDNGELISLSQRFNSKSEDIRR